MDEWTGRLTRADAIRIIESITDKDDPAWEWAVEDFYDEESDTMPSIYDVLHTLGVGEAEYKDAVGAVNVNWPSLADDLFIEKQVRIDVMESALREAIDKLKQVEPFAGRLSLISLFETALGVPAQ